MCKVQAGKDAQSPGYNQRLARIQELRNLGYARPDLYWQRGGAICARCGGKTRSVLDGEAWCDACKRYQ
jgi:hypothetical protein